MARKPPNSRVRPQTTSDPIPEAADASALESLPGTPTSRRQFGARLLPWYAENGRELPWRNNPEPYAVWVSEVMLQQTQVSTVLPYFERWMRRFPTLTALAAAEEADVLSHWQGLGYYSRARSLLKGARVVVTELSAQLPRDVHSLKRLPGIGAYTAGAVASIAYEQDTPVVDGNVIRVLTRVFALGGDPTKKPLQNQLWSLAAVLIPKGQARHFNQALMELGALVCSPKTPRCLDCPVRTLCAAHAQGQELKYPEKKKPPAITRQEHTAIMLKRRGRLLLLQNAADAQRWASMWMFPTLEQHPGESPRDAAQRRVQELFGQGGEVLERLTEVVHSVTRYRIQLSLVEVSVNDSLPRPKACRWHLPGALGDLAMPAAHRKLANWLASRR